ncbi:hypothetical protein LSH36_274g01058 [Paralvinella palmiformis]|uniref:Sodium/calcium exchanger membrane region domain-containing protein n=1 Tax=Paralvinella palmiformis TaxID=53620 RepID=A0AAD9JJH1_9ANNE|nr:hypothetical protein LSH36_274g01058 [Paralvinella palmiformis]
MSLKSPDPEWAEYLNTSQLKYHAKRQCSSLPQRSLCLRRTPKLPRVLLLLGVLLFLLFLQMEFFTAGNNMKPGADDYLDAVPIIDELRMSYHQEHRLEHGSVLSRKLLGISRNCTPPAIEQFPKTIFSPKQRRQGAIFLHVFVAAYMFIALAIACDDYFVPACEKLCDLLHMSDDVAGATFMAAGSSAPELATSCIGVFIAKDDIGLGAVVGSAVFNIMFVISVCALFAGQVVPLKWWPLVRDCIYYTISILALVFVIYDEVVEWYEAAILLILYFFYIVIMYFNPKLEAKLTPIGDRLCCKRSQEAEPLPLKSNEQNSANHMTFTDDGQSSDVDEATETSGIHSVDKDTSPWVLHPPDGALRCTLWVIALPLIIIMFISIPDCRQPRWQKCYIITFIMSILWIGVFSYIMVWMITIIGFTCGIPDTVMGLTFIAAGSSVPDAIASLIVVREGLGDMAISNAVGSNVFDILLCLGFPWLLQTTAITPNEGVVVYSAGLTYSSLTLLSTVVFLLVATHLNGWRLTKGYGVILMIVYVLFNILACLYELNIFGYVRPPECASDY